MVDDNWSRETEEKRSSDDRVLDPEVEAFCKILARVIACILGA